jgi:glycine cleavage system H protein
MPSVRGCNLPDELLYDVNNHIWFTAYTPKKVGRSVRAGKSCGTLESGKWVGPAKSAAGGEVVAVNDDLVADPSIANDDPYDKGWLAILKPDDWDSVKGSLIAGGEVAGPYEAKMDAEGFGGCA